MPKYLCLQRALPGGDREGDHLSPTQIQAMYEKFTEWRQIEATVESGGRDAGSARSRCAIAIRR